MRIINESPCESREPHGRHYTDHARMFWCPGVEARPRCACRLHDVPGISDHCTAEATVGCYVCGRKLCRECSWPVLVNGAMASICTPTLSESMCQRAIGLRAAYAQESVR